MNRTYRKILRNRKQRIERRLQPKHWEDQPRPMLKARNVHYELAERVAAMNCGGIGAMHLMVQRLGLVEDIDKNLHLLKVHLPYHESDHVLHLTYNLLAGGQRIEDTELHRQDEVFLNGLGAERIPDPTTAGDFTRRFQVEDIVALEECVNRARLAVWKVQPAGFLKEAFVGVDGGCLGKHFLQDRSNFKTSFQQSGREVCASITLPPWPAPHRFMLLFAEIPQSLAKSSEASPGGGGSGKLVPSSFFPPL